MWFRRFLVRKDDGEGGATTLPVGCLDRVRESALLVALDAHAVDHHFERRSAPQSNRIDVFEGERLAVEKHTSEPAAPQHIHCLRDGVDAILLVVLSGSGWT